MIKRMGFTLIELLVSVAIIAILTALAAVSFTGAQKKSRDARRSQDMRLVQIAAEQYASANRGSYPASTALPWVIGGQTILDVLPIDPKTGGNYIYNIGATGNIYCFCATMENPTFGNATTSDISCTFSTAATGNTGPYFCVENKQ